MNLCLISGALKSQIVNVSGSMFHISADTSIIDNSNLGLVLGNDTAIRDHEKWLPFWMAYWGSMGWRKGKSTGNHRSSNEKWDCPVFFSLKPINWFQHHCEPCLILKFSRHQPARCNVSDRSGSNARRNRLWNLLWKPWKMVHLWMICHDLSFLKRWLSMFWSSCWFVYKRVN